MSSNLQFQDFGLGDSPFTDKSENSNYDRRHTEKDSANLVDGTETSESTGNKYSFLSFKFYQQYFDVDTEQVQTRILNSAFPKRDFNFIREHLNPTPDLYGPFWIAVTLVFCTAICGNFAHYIGSVGEAFYANDFKLVTGISTLITCYLILVPFALYLTFYYRNATIQYSYIELVALYGYSLSIFIPVSVLFVLNYSLFRWSLIGISVVLSGSVLATTIWDAIKSDKNKLLAIGVVFGVVFLHAGLAIGMKEYYFDTISPANSGKVDLPPNIPKASPLNETQLEVKPIAEALVASNISEIVKPAQLPKQNTDKTKRETPKPKVTVAVKQPEVKEEAEPKRALTTEKPIENKDKNARL